MKIKDQKGFSLVELLVVISIIGMLSTMAVVSLGNAREKGRDAKRLNDVRQIQMALELYYNTDSSYPAEGEINTLTDNILDNNKSIATSSKTFMALIPQDPLYTDTSGSDFYKYYTDGEIYVIKYELESGAANLDSGFHCASNEGGVSHFEGTDCASGTAITAWSSHFN